MQKWTIETIHDALGNPALAARFLSEINRAPAHELLSVFARWARIAEDLTSATEHCRELAVHEAQGKDLPGEWIDVTEKVLDEAGRRRGRGAA
jgi:hypothetical protein